jgi:hypothetical protein
MNMDIRKTLTAVAFFLTAFLFGNAQSYDSTELTYKDGYGKLEKLVLNETSISDVLQNDSFYKKQYLYYQVIFNVSKEGAIGDIWINSLFDTALVGSILSAMKKTNGLWVNHSGAELVAVLPIFYNNVSNDTLSDIGFKQLYDRIDNTQSVKIYSSFFQNWNLQKIVHLKAIKIVAIPPVR